MRWVGKRWRGSWLRGGGSESAAQRIKRMVEVEIMMGNLGYGKATRFNNRLTCANCSSINGNDA